MPPGKQLWMTSMQIAVHMIVLGDCDVIYFEAFIQETFGTTSPIVHGFLGLLSDLSVWDRPIIYCRVRSCKPLLNSRLRCAGGCD